MIKRCLRTKRSSKTGASQAASGTAFLPFANSNSTDATASHSHNREFAVSGTLFALNEGPET